MGVLEKIACQSDLKKLNVKELETLSTEIRERILSVTKNNGGHLSSNLGIVETTVALHYVFDFPKDKLIFDVGHQCYAHKLLSDRKDKFYTIRTDGGLSGFPDIEESEYDAFSSGHAGNSIAAGLGYSEARDKTGGNYKVIDLVGDGSFVNGLNLEALTSSMAKPKNYIVILNDNGMSISKNRNGLYGYISKLTAKESYTKSKRRIKKIFGNSFVTKILRKIRTVIKRISNRGLDFEKFGFKYVGIVDGNNVSEMIRILERVKVLSQDKAVLLHIKTTKGKGYNQAEEHADLYHGVGKNLSYTGEGFSETLGDIINSLMEKDDKVVAITAGMRDGTGLYKVANSHPDRFYDVGIAEEYAVTFASGLALGGLKPIVAIYSTFLQRAYDQVVHDVCMQNLPVVFCMDRAGLIGEDGKSHQGVFDLSYLRHIPNITLLAPNSKEELADALNYALSLNSPVAIRYPKTYQVKEREFIPLDKGLWQTLIESTKINILAVGPRMLNEALKVASLNSEVGVISARTVKPLDEKVLNKIKDSIIITVEENAKAGGFGSAVLEYYSAKNISARVHTLGVKDEFEKHGSLAKQIKNNSLDCKYIQKFVNKFLKST